LSVFYTGCLRTRAFYFKTDSFWNILRQTSKIVAIKGSLITGLTFRAFIYDK